MVFHIPVALVIPAADIRDNGRGKTKMKHALICVYAAFRLMFFVTGCSSEMTVVKADLVESEAAATAQPEIDEELEHQIQDGLMLFRQGDFDAAVDAFREATAIDPDDWQPYYFLGLVKSEVGEYQVANAFLREALNLAPSGERVRSRIYFALAENFEYQRQLGRAEQHYRMALKLYPGFAEAEAAMARLGRAESPSQK